MHLLEDMLDEVFWEGIALSLFTFADTRDTILKIGEPRMSVKSDAVTNFNAFFAEFRKTDLWLAMVNTREDSPWHREENVGVHTRMLIEWYMENLADKRSDTQRMTTLVACLFHDVGKPPAEITKFSEERGEYRAYHGHEQLSARIWVDYALANRHLTKDLLKFSIEDVSNISMMLEYHVPFGLKDKAKRKNLKDSFMLRMGEAGHRAWLDLLLSDQHGRISDGQAEKLAAVDVWMNEWESV